MGLYKWKCDYLSPVTKFLFKMIVRYVVLLFCITSLFWSVVTEVVNTSSCALYNQPCISEVRVKPCAEAPNKPCKIKRGEEASIEIDFTPSFASDKLKSQAYWDNGFVDLPLRNMETDACKSITCPVTKDTKQTYKYGLSIAKSFPVSTYTVKWKFTGDESNQVCCIKFRIKLVR